MVPTMLAIVLARLLPCGTSTGSQLDMTQINPFTGFFSGEVSASHSEWFCGSRVIETMGSRISKMTPSLGFTVVLTASVVVMVCSMAGIPTSTTHCQVMGVVGAGIARGWVDTGALKEGFNTIDFSLMRNIALSWIATIPFAMALSALVYAVADVIL